MRYTLVALTSLLSTIHALTITSPTTGSTVDPSKPFTIRWTLTGADPASINLVFINNGADQTLASNVQTSELSYTVPANTVLTYGAGFSVAALSSSGNNLASSGNFILNYGGATVVTVNGQLSLVTSGAAATATASSLSFDTSGVSGQSVTATYLSGSSTATGATAVTASSTDSSSRPFTTHGIQSFSGTTFTTSSSSASSTGGSTTASSSATRSSATASSSANAQSRNVVGKEAMSAAGVLAGLIALLA